MQVLLAEDDPGVLRARLRQIKIIRIVGTKNSPGALGQRQVIDVTFAKQAQVTDGDGVDAPPHSWSATATGRFSSR